MRIPLRVTASVCLAVAASGLSLAQLPKQPRVKAPQVTRGVTPGKARVTPRPVTRVVTPRVIRVVPARQLPFPVTPHIQPLNARVPQVASTYDPDSAQLLRRMMDAENTTTYIARESTMRADRAGNEQLVKSDPRQGLRRESVNGNGRVYLDNFRNVYRFNPARPGDAVTIEQSRLARRSATRGEDMVRRLTRGMLAARIVGQDTVAGRGSVIVEVRAPRTPSTPTRRFWIDRETGLRLRTEGVDAAGRVLSSSYYTTLNLAPVFAPDDFTPPVPGNGIPTASGTVPTTGQRRRFNTVAEARQAGFVVVEPTYLPPGYALRLIEATANDSHLALRYANGLNTFSLTILRDGIPPRVRPFLRSDGSAYVPGPQGKNGLFVRGTGNSAYLVLGDLPEAELRRIAAGVR